MVETVARIRDSLPVEDRARLGILAGDDGEVGAANLYGPTYGLPSAISGMNSHWLRGYGDPPPQTIIAHGPRFPESQLCLLQIRCPSEESLRYREQLYRRVLRGFPLPPLAPALAAVLENTLDITEEGRLCLEQQF
jgi:hypothetical protein